MVVLTATWNIAINAMELANFAVTIVEMSVDNGFDRAHEEEISNKIEM
jgi:hypothetical protein